MTKKYFNKKYNKELNALGLGTHLFVKVPWPRNSEGVFLVLVENCLIL